MQAVAGEVGVDPRAGFGQRLPAGVVQQRGVGEGAQGVQVLNERLERAGAVGDDQDGAAGAAGEGPGGPGGGAGGEFLRLALQALAEGEFERLAEFRVSGRGGKGAGRGVVSGGFGFGGGHAEAISNLKFQIPTLAPADLSRCVRPCWR